jgi:hypothetical protein
MEINLDADQANLEIDGNAVHTWPFHYKADATNGINQLGGVNLYAGSPVPNPSNPNEFLPGTYYIDNFKIYDATEPEPCNPATNLAVNYAPGCAGAQLTWNAPAKGASKAVLLSEDFEGLPNGSSHAALPGWILVDVDGDENYWYGLKNAGDPIIPGHSGTGLMTSASYAGVALTPDNYLISPLVTGATSVTYWVSAQDELWAAEHYALCASTTGNNTPDFTIVFQETLTSKGGDREKGIERGGSRAQGTWYERTVNLPAGTKYIAWRHFNCTDMFRLNLDDVTVYGSATTDFVYNIYRDNTLIKANHPETSYTDIDFSTNESHTWSVKTVCQSGESAPVSVTKGPCGTFIPVTNIENLPTEAFAGVPLTLSGTVVPSNATNQTITWNVVTQGGTGATVSNNIFNATATGTADLWAVITNGLAGDNYVQPFSITVIRAQLTGEVTISGNAVFGQTLTAIPSLSSTPLVTLGALTHQWKRNGTNISGATNATYTLAQADIGATITVTVTAANCNGSVTSAATPTVTKAPQTAPAAPTMASNTATSITLNPISGYEYNINSSTFTSNNIFSGLQPGTSYPFTQRKAETETHLASPASPVASFSTPLGIDDNELVNIKIYSHLNSVYIKNESNTTLKSVEITDMYGRTVYRDIVNNVETVITLQIANGIYMVKLITEEENTVAAKISIMK